jgi:fatty-acyl-CoA synthase
VLGHGPDDVVFAGTPLFHSGGIVNRTMSPFFQGMTNVILSPHGFRNKNSVKHYWRLVARYGETELIAVPTILSALANMPPGDIDISSLKPYANTGSAGMPAGLARTLEEKLGIAILSNYGLTENTASAAVPPRSEVRHGSSGMRIPYTQIKTLRVDGAGHVLGDCKPDEIGAIAVKGPGVIEGYVDPALNHDLFFDGGWLNTGDLGRIDAEGYLWVTGRIKDLIIRGGNNIDPQQIDEALLEHDAVELAAAVGKPDGYAGEMPVAYVQLKEGAAADPEEIREFARARIPERAAVPAEIFIIDPMPLTEVGKIYKPPLRRDAARRAFEAALAPLVGNGVSVSVEVRDDPAMGTLAAVTLSGDGDRAALAEKAAEILGAFTLAHEVAWA